jgi:6-phosphogluconate dehydrogenase
MGEKKYQIGMVGLGVMGRNLVFNMSDHGYSVAGYDKDLSKVKALNQVASDRNVFGFENLEDFVSSLSIPRAVMMLVPAGPAVDAVIMEVLPHLSKGDLIIDGGNSFFKDTNRRGESLEKSGIQYLGMGISGGESGARYGPSMMPGGHKEAYNRVRPIFEAVAAQVNGEACVTYLGPGSAGHYVKMVHNGIEYGIMQLLAESYDLMKRGLNFSNEDLTQIYKEWNQGELNSYLVEITADIFREIDEKTGKHLIDLILDQAKQKGTGMWTSQDAMDLQVPVPTIDMAVVMRNLSASQDERSASSQVYQDPAPNIQLGRKKFIESLQGALYGAMIIAYAQGMALLRHATKAYQYDLDLEAVARIWRGGCIIRSALLEPIRNAYRSNPDLVNLLVDPHFSNIIRDRQSDLREVIRIAVEEGIPVPGFMAALAYYDSYRSGWLPANLIQAQRDYFGAHTYERLDAKGVFHTEWKAD